MATLEHSIERAIALAVAAFEALDRDCFKASKIFVNDVLPQLSASPEWVSEFEARTYYRCLSTEYEPLSVAGSLAAGGRFNVGGSQAGGISKKVIGPLASMRGAIYLSESWQTAAVEKYQGVAEPETIFTILRADSSVTVYEISLQRRKKLKLVDYERASRAIESAFPSVRTLLATTANMSGEWSDLKRPAPCQLLGHWLVNSLEADGIRYESVLYPEHFNVCLHLKDDLTAKKLLKAKAHATMP